MCGQSDRDRPGEAAHQVKNTSNRKLKAAAVSLVTMSMVTLMLAVPAAADRNIKIILTGTSGEQITRFVTVDDTEPIDALSLATKFAITDEIVSITDVTPAPKPKPKPKPKPHKPAVKPHKSKPKHVKRKAPTVTIGLPGLTPLGTPGELISQFSIPPFLLPIYQAAGIEYGIPWQVLAAINSVETNYGRNLSTSSAGAVGWMQFMPATWKTYGVDASGDGKADPYNPADAIFAAAKYLKASGGTSDIKAAIFSYNHAGWYVNDVIHRARMLAGLPDQLVGSLTALAEAMYPVDGPATSSARSASSGSSTTVHIKGKPGAAVVAAADGKIVKIGTSTKIGRYIILRDALGNTFTYSGLGTISRRHVMRKEMAVSPRQLSKELRLSLHGEPSASGEATAGSASILGAADDRRRLFANPSRPKAYKAGGEEQLAEAAGPANLADWFTVPVNIPRREAVIRSLKAGSTVIGGTIIGRVNTPADSDTGSINFGIRPAGKNAPAIDPTPILAGWKLLAASTNGGAGLRFAALGSGSPTLGQVLLMGKSSLGHKVLSDPRITIYDCGRADIEAGAVDRRVLATLVYLADNGMNPTVSSLTCGHPYLSKAGQVSEHSAGAAVDIAAINGTPILGNQGRGSVTDRAVRLLLALQGAMHPHQIITLMKYTGTDNTLALADHDDHIHVGFYPDGSTGLLTTSGKEISSQQWSTLIGRLRSVANPRVTSGTSKFATRSSGRG